MRLGYALLKESPRTPLNSGETNENMQMWWDNKRIADKDWLENKMYRLWLVNFNKDKL
jgi:hypothetical protein